MQEKNNNFVFRKKKLKNKVMQYKSTDKINKLNAKFAN